MITEHEIDIIGAYLLVLYLSDKLLFNFTITKTLRKLLYNLWLLFVDLLGFPIALIVSLIKHIFKR